MLPPICLEVGGKISLSDLAVSLRTWLHVLAATAELGEILRATAGIFGCTTPEDMTTKHWDGTIDDMLFVIQQKSIANRTTPLGGSRNTKDDLYDLSIRVYPQIKPKQNRKRVASEAKLEARSPLTTRRGRKARRRRSRACHRRRHR